MIRSCTSQTPYNSSDCKIFNFQEYIYRKIFVIHFLRKNKIKTYIYIYFSYTIHTIQQYKVKHATISFFLKKYIAGRQKILIWQKYF